MSAGDYGLVPFVDSQISVITSDGRQLFGVLRGFDQMSNLIMDDCHERVYSSKAGVEQVALGGLHIVRGDNIVLVGEVDVEKDQTLDLSTIRAAPLKPLVH